MRLVGLIVVRNFRSLDYTPIEAAKSLIPHCDEVVISDMKSDDGSFDELWEFGKTDDRLRIVQQPWGDPFNNPEWWVDALNYARENFLYGRDFLLQLDADEVLGPECRDGIQMCKQDEGSALFRRFNFWKDPQHLAPENRVCGTMVARMGPANVWLPSDEPNPKRRPHLRERAQDYPQLNIYHYGFLRDPKAFLRKAQVVQEAFFGSTDERLTSVKDSEIWYDKDFFDGLPLRDFIGNHPPEILPWLRRFYTL
jgi:hypothetical protein